MRAPSQDGVADGPGTWASMIDGKEQQLGKTVGWFGRAFCWFWLVGSYFFPFFSFDFVFFVLAWFWYDFCGSAVHIRARVEVMG